jgi:hypothetical protein
MEQRIFQLIQLGKNYIDPIQLQILYNNVDNVVYINDVLLRTCAICDPNRYYFGDNPESFIPADRETACEMMAWTMLHTFRYTLADNNNLVVEQIYGGFIRDYIFGGRCPNDIDVAVTKEDAYGSPDNKIAWMTAFVERLRIDWPSAAMMQVNGNYLFTLSANESHKHCLHFKLTTLTNSKYQVGTPGYYGKPHLAPTDGYEGQRFDCQYKFFDTPAPGVSASCDNVAIKLAGLTSKKPGLNGQNSPFSHLGISIEHCIKKQFIFWHDPVSRQERIDRLTKRGWEHLNPGSGGSFSRCGFKAGDEWKFLLKSIEIEVRRDHFLETTIQFNNEQYGRALKIVRPLQQQPAQAFAAQIPQAFAAQTKQRIQLNFPNPYNPLTDLSNFKSWNRDFVYIEEPKGLAITPGPFQPPKNRQNFPKQQQQNQLIKPAQQQNQLRNPFSGLLNRSAAYAVWDKDPNSRYTRIDLNPFSPFTQREAWDEWIRLFGKKKGGSGISKEIEEDTASTPDEKWIKFYDVGLALIPELLLNTNKSNNNKSTLFIGGKRLEKIKNVTKKKLKNLKKKTNKKLKKQKTKKYRKKRNSNIKKIEK